MANISRSYRPQCFLDVVGQSNTTETLRREVEQKKLGHAYLFSGPRGVGKTTIARIFAKAVNCKNPQKGEPCLECESCKLVAGGSAIDIIEMDAASHTGVDNVREAIVEHVRFVPAALKYKVYIIDEAHMLSVNAWNALLKTIEEPPEYAIFIFATTEKHKVPATIISRCQRFNFSRITETEIASRIKEIATKEAFKIDDSVVSLIAQKTDGCLRDAENLLGQLMSLGEKNITRDIASIIIPTSQMPVAAELISLVINKDIAKILTRVEELEQEGLSFIPLFDDLIDSVRKINFSVNLPDYATKLQSGDESEKILARLSGQITTQKLLQDSLILMEKRREIKTGLDPRFALELALIAMAIEDNENHQPPQPSNPKINEAISSPKPVDPVAEKPKLEESTQNKTTPTESSLNIKNNVSLNEIHSIWPKLLQSLEDNKSLLMILKPSRLAEVQGNTLMIHFQYPYHQKTIIDNAKNKSIIEDLLNSLTGCQNLCIQGISQPKDQTESVNPKAKTDAVSNLLDAFGGQVIS